MELLRQKQGEKRKMRENRRSLIQRETEILEICVDEIKPTHLLYSTNSNYDKLNEIVSSLVDRNLLERVKVKETDQRTIFHFKTTEKGINYVDQLKEALKYGNHRDS